ncbi:hydantoinase/oxoprolinase family protein [Variovorax defluvii]|uniref:Hydantoinase/oxoprolinase family protein n=1 Tax=Variovorax defluvii TaxID=913761 RepID=A0ABP8I1E7_9BURK
MSRARYLIGIDVGGTFTDVLAYEPTDCKLMSAKVPSMPGAQWRGVLDALQELGISPADIRAFVHGTTIATNGLLERKGSATALLVTEGFRDLLEIGKARRLIGGLFELDWQKPAPIVARELRFEAPERVAADGTVLRSLEGFDAAPLARALREAGIETLAIAFVNSYVNAANEAHAAQALRQLLPGMPVTTSAQLVSARGEFERTSTAVLNAYLTPMMAQYLERLQGELRARGVAAPVNIMGSNGGAMTLAAAARRVSGTFLSGPVGGVNGAVQIARMLGIEDVITLDMGGTSTDVALVHQLEPRMSYDNQVDAYPLLMPQLDIHAIGAGGGSLVWVGPDGTLQIGPGSAGALPGPACYGRGGTEPTISDANLLLGRLPADHLLSGGLRLRLDLAEQAFRAVADKLGETDLHELAARALRVATAKMAGAVREVSVHRGFDPRDFVLLGYGGAGPMHVFEVAQELAISTVVIPRFPGHLSALGQMLADLRRDSVRVWGGRLSQLQPALLDEQIGAMRAEAAAQLERDGMPPQRQRHAARLDMRYRGQSFTLQVPYEPAQDWTLLREAFDRRHEETFGYAARDTDVEIVNLRLVSLGLVDKPQLRFTQEAAGGPRTGNRPVWFDGWVDCTIHERERMPAGHCFSGPAVVTEAGGTSVVPPGWDIRVHESGSMLCTYTRLDND